MEAIVGRDGELEAVDEFLHGADARPRVMLLEGEAGIGKTTVWEEAARAAEAEFRVLRSRALAVESQISYSAADDLLSAPSARSRSPVEPAIRPTLPSPRGEPHFTVRAIQAERAGEDTRAAASTRMPRTAGSSSPRCPNKPTHCSAGAAASPLSAIPGPTGRSVRPAPSSTGWAPAGGSTNATP